MKKIWIVLIVIILLGVMAFLMIKSAIDDSITADEGVHIFSGYTYWLKNDYRFNGEHPPLVKRWATIPLIFIKPQLPSEFDQVWSKSKNFYYDSWLDVRLLSEKFLFGIKNNAEKIILSSRLMMIAITLILAWFIFFWAKKIYGLKAGLLALIITIIFPSFLSHGRLVTTDVPIALFFALSVYFFGEFLKKPTWKNAVIGGILLGLLFLIKFTAIIILPILITLTIIKLWSLKLRWKNYGLKIISIFAIGYLIILAGYFPHYQSPSSVSSLSEEIRKNNQSEFNQPFLNRIFPIIRPFLIPRDFFKGEFYVIGHALGGHDSFLLGKVTKTGWWYYFPLAFLFKVPLGFLIMIFSVISYLIWKEKKLSYDDWLIILPPALYFTTTIFSRADLGERHLMPIYPFLIIFASQIANFKIEKKLLWTTILTLIVWQIIALARVYPNTLAYFNEINGGPAKGYEKLTDSNIDWGQDFKRLKKWMDQNRIKEINMDYGWAGELAPRYYGINVIPLNPKDQDRKGYFALGATAFNNPTDGGYSWLKTHPPLIQIKYSMLIFYRAPVFR